MRCDTLVGTFHVWLQRLQDGRGLASGTSAIWFQCRAPNGIIKQGTAGVGQALALPCSSLPSQKRLPWLPGRNYELAPIGSQRALFRSAPPPPAYRPPLTAAGRQTLCLASPRARLGQICPRLRSRVLWTEATAGTPLAACSAALGNLALHSSRYMSKSAHSSPWALSPDTCSALLRRGTGTQLDIAKLSLLWKK